MRRFYQPFLTRAAFGLYLSSVLCDLRRPPYVYHRTTRQSLHPFMKKLFLLLLLFLPLTLQSCRCADEPEVGPVEERGE